MADLKTWLMANGVDEGGAETMIDHFGEGKLHDLLEEERAKGDARVTVPGGTDENGHRTQARTTTVGPFGRVYWNMIRTMGPPSGMVIVSRRPTPARAWFEVQLKRDEANPTFSHPLVAEALQAVGGYKVLKERSWSASKKDFEMTYKGLME